MEGSALLYQCNPGFGPVGEMTAVCAANGNWSPDPANVTCREIGMIGKQVATIHAIHQVVLNSQYKMLRWLPQLMNGHMHAWLF